MISAPLDRKSKVDKVTNRKEVGGATDEDRGGAHRLKYTGNGRLHDKQSQAKNKDRKCEERHDRRGKISKIKPEITNKSRNHDTTRGQM